MVENRVCVVTHPIEAAGENATQSLLAVLSAISSVSLITPALPIDPVIRRSDVFGLLRLYVVHSAPVAWIQLASEGFGFVPNANLETGQDETITYSESPNR